MLVSNPDAVLNDDAAFVDTVDVRMLLFGSGICNRAEADRLAKPLYVVADGARAYSHIKVICHLASIRMSSGKVLDAW